MTGQEAPAAFQLCLPSAGLRGACVCARLCMWVLGMQARVFILMWWAHTNLASLQHKASSLRAIFSSNISYNIHLAFNLWKCFKCYWFDLAFVQCEFFSHQRCYNFLSALADKICNNNAIVLVSPRNTSSSRSHFWNLILRSLLHLHSQHCLHLQLHKRTSLSAGF